MLKKKFLVLFFVVCLLISGCLTPGTKVKVTDQESGNSVTVSKDGLEVDIKTIEKDGIVVEVESGETE